MFVGVSSASAHTPTVGATCDGVTVSASGYESGDTNTLSVSVSGGGSDSKSFSTSGSATASVPQDGVAHTYTAFVHTTNGNAAYSKDFSGTVGPCGTPTKPDDTVEHRDVVGEPNCTTHTVTTAHESRTIPTVLVNNVWVAGTPTEWVTDSSSSVITTHEQCPTGTQPPNDTELRDVAGSPDCTVFTVTTQHQSRSRTYSFDDASWTWVAGEWSSWATDSSTTEPATLEECPPPTKPEPIVSDTSIAGQSCGDAFVTTTTETTTTDYVLDEVTRIWALGEPVVTTTAVETPVTPVDCAETVSDSDTPETELLPDTGGASLGYGLAGLVLLLGGSFILMSQRRTATVAAGHESDLGSLIQRNPAVVSPRQWSVWVTKQNLRRRSQRRTDADE
ncbi:MAG: hypothetical protein ABIN55_01160 [Aeromicrobium sp.]